MVQNVLALIIVYYTAAWAIYSIVKNLKTKNSKCNGCGSACGIKNLNITKFNEL
jgi:hypothetical protein